MTFAPLFVLVFEKIRASINSLDATFRSYHTINFCVYNNMILISFYTLKINYIPILRVLFSIELKMAVFCLNMFLNHS